MTMLNLDLFAWWAMTITGGIVFLILVSIYLYANSGVIRRESTESKAGTRLRQDFIFVWVLIGLLAFYIVSVNMGSSTVFAAGNIIVEVMLIAYLIRNKAKRSAETARPRSQ
jgi:Flp pilus assembly protein TadB